MKARTAVLTLALAGLPAAAEVPAWIGRSDRNARLVLETLARFGPEGAGRLGVEGLDEEVLDLGPGVFERTLVAQRELLVELVARQQELQRASNDLNRKLRESPADAALKAENAALRAELQRVVAEVRALDQGLRRFGRPATHGTNGYTSATPVAAGERLWVLFGTGVVAAFDLDDRRLWARVAGRPIAKHKKFA